jgi:lysophospholipase
MDWRGQGGSSRQLPDPRKGHVDDFSDYRKDIDAVLAQVLEGALPKPWFALAHSMGAAALLLALDGGETRFDRAAMLSPLAGLKVVRTPRLAKLLAQALDFLALGGAYVPLGGSTPLATKPFAGNRVTTDPDRYTHFAELNVAAPHLALGDPTVGWVHAMYRAFDRFADRDFGRAVKVPTLMLVAGADPLCDSAAAEELATRVRGCRALVIPGARHELLFERDELRDLALAALAAFIPGEHRAEALGPANAAEGG